MLNNAGRGMIDGVQGIFCCLCMLLIGPPIFWYVGVDSLVKHGEVTTEKCVVDNATAFSCTYMCNCKKDNQDREVCQTCNGIEWKYEISTSKCPETVMKEKSSDCQGSALTEFTQDEEFTCYVPDCSREVWMHESDTLLTAGIICLSFAVVGTLCWVALCMMVGCCSEKLPKPMQRMMGKRAAGDEQYVPSTHPQGDNLPPAQHQMPQQGAVVGQPGIPMAQGVVVGQPGVPMAQGMMVGQPPTAYGQPAAVAYAQPVAYGQPAPVVYQPAAYGAPVAGGPAYAPAAAPAYNSAGSLEGLPDTDPLPTYQIPSTDNYDEFGNKISPGQAPAYGSNLS